MKLTYNNIIVHNGVFHADDLASAAFAVTLALVPSKTCVIRTRDLSKVTEDDLVVDVGEGPLDHHGKAAGKTFTVDGIVVPHCGVTLMLQEVLSPEVFATIAPGMVNLALQDNGVEANPKFPQNPFAFVHAFNTRWDGWDETADEQFKAALGIAIPVAQRLHEQAVSACDAKATLDSLDWTAPVVEIPAGLPGWQAKAVPGDAKFVIFRGTPDTPWYLQCVPDKVGSFGQKTPHPKAWCGERGDAIPMDGGVFVHAGGFISGWKTLKSALDAAREILGLTLDVALKGVRSEY